MKLWRVVSGGQTGVDRAALDVALELGVSCGGWCPMGRLAEDGPIDERYPLQETESDQYAVRTRRNVQDSDATLILNCGDLSGGTAATVRFAEELGRPFLVVQLDEPGTPSEVVRWIQEESVGVLNVAGPRESKESGIHRAAAAYLRSVLDSENLQ